MKIWDIIKEDFEGHSFIEEDWKRNVVAGAMAVSSMLGARGQDSHQQQYQPQRTSISTTQGQNLDASILAQWNNYIVWLKSKGLSGNKKMNNVAFSKSTLDEYNKEHPESKLTYDLVKPIQTQIKKYRQSIINYAKNGGQIEFVTKPNADYSNFMSWAIHTSEDGINGEFTSQFLFPKNYLVDLNTNKTTDLGYATAKNM